MFQINELKTIFYNKHLSMKNIKRTYEFEKVFKFS